MKKQSKRLSLNRESVRILTTLELIPVGGGGTSAAVCTDSRKETWCVGCGTSTC